MVWISLYVTRITRMFVRFISRQSILDIFVWILHNFLHRYGMSNDWRFATRIIAFNEPHTVRLVLDVIDYDEPNMYLTIQIIPQPNHRLLDDSFAPLRFAKWTPNCWFGDLLKTNNSWFFLHLEHPSGSLWNAQFMFSLLAKEAPLLQSTTVICYARASIYKSHKSHKVKCGNIWQINLDISELDAPSVWNNLILLS